MIAFNQETRQFSVVDEVREYGIVSGLKKATAVTKGVGGLARAVSGTAGAMGLNPEKETFWGNFNGKNKRVRQMRENAHKERMARIAAGTDTRTLLKDRLAAQDARKDKKMDNKQALTLRKMDSKDKSAELKAGLVSQRIDRASKKNDRKYELKGKKLDAKFMNGSDERNHKLEMAKAGLKDRQNERDLALEGLKARLKDNQSERDNSLAKLKERKSVTAIPWKKRI